LLSGFQEGFKRLPILLEHPDELDPISHLGIAGNHGGGDQDGSFDGKLQIQISPDWEWENCLDVAAAQNSDRQQRHESGYRPRQSVFLPAHSLLCVRIRDGHSGRCCSWSVAFFAECISKHIFSLIFILARTAKNRM